MMIHKIIGLMSGTSLDGLDIAHCTFFKKEDKWFYDISVAETVEYEETLIARLKNAFYGSAEALMETDAYFANFIGTKVKDFISRHYLSPDFISSHGQTIFHQPAKGFTCQIGNGGIISAITGFPVVSDFRTLDVGLKGQGAPLVPIGDKLLFSSHKYCLNLGGIANISFEHDNKRIAFDVCPVNLVLNYYANKSGKPYDENGSLAAKGTVNHSILQMLSDLDFYSIPFPKSLGWEYISEKVIPLLEDSGESTENILATFCRHIAIQISAVANEGNAHDLMLITGGGAFNKHLIKEIAEAGKDKFTVEVPSENLIMFKEALIFAFLGLLRVNNEINTLKTVTGASSDSLGGALYGRIPY
jgi:anhydro-N-acetylmuramic acid kinase